MYRLIKNKKFNTPVTDRFPQQAPKKAALKYVMPPSAPLQGAEISLRVFEPTTVTEVFSVLPSTKLGIEGMGWSDPRSVKEILSFHH